MSNTLNDKLARIQAEFKSKKSRYNSFGKYYFRSAEDVLEALKPFSVELGVTFLVAEEVSEVAGIPIITSTASITDGKDTISAKAVVGVDLDQKGMQMPQKFGSASSYGKKYSLGNLLLIDDTQDSDATNDHGKNKIVTERPTYKDKPWLNAGTPEYDKALAFVKSKETYDQVRSKYQMSNKVNEALLALVA